MKEKVSTPVFEFLYCLVGYEFRFWPFMYELLINAQQQPFCKGVEENWLILSSTLPRRQTHLHINIFKHICTDIHTRTYKTNVIRWLCLLGHQMTSGRKCKWIYDVKNIRKREGINKEYIYNI